MFRAADRSAPVPLAGDGTDVGFPEIDGASPAIRRLKRHMARVAADRDVTVLVLGESGTGKDRVAHAIHRASPRSDSPFVVVNCAGLSATLAEDELFGHVRGAFTGAHEARPGPFERAAGGTVFLDEIGDLAPNVQMKLLRAIQRRTVQRLGDVRETSFDVRIIAATNVDLAAAVRAGRFREDLYYRIAVYEVLVPALRVRGAEDIRALARVLLRGCAERRRRAIPGIAPEVLDRLVRHRWPGNVRELENTLEHMIVAAGASPVLTPRHLPARLNRELPVLQGPRPSAAELAAALERHQGRTGRAAAAVGLSRHQFYRLARRYRLAANRRE